MATPAAVSVHDDFAARQAAVTNRSANHEAAGGVDVVNGLAVHKLVGQQWAHHLLKYFAAQAIVVGVSVVLGRDHHGCNARRLFVPVLHAYLRLGVGPEVVGTAGLSQLREVRNDRVRQGYGQGHELGRLVAGVTEHKPLVAGALLLVPAVANGHAHRDVWRLGVEPDDDLAAVGVKTLGA